MSKEIDELLSLFAMVTSNNPPNIQNASMKLIEWANKPNYSLNLLYIIIHDNIEEILRFSAAIQLKNMTDKHWQRSTLLNEDDKFIIRNQILSYVVDFNNQTSRLYNLLAEIIARISRFDWNLKWPNLFNDLFSKDAWLIIYRVCQVQSTRRLSQGIVLFKELASVLSSQILLKWKSFTSNFHTKYQNHSNDPTLLIDFYNAAYQLRTLSLFIMNTHLITNEDQDFCNIINNISFEICSYFPNFLKCYFNSLSVLSENVNAYFYKFLKSMVWILLSYQNKVSSKSFQLTKDVENLVLSAIFHSHYLDKSDKLTLLLMNLLLNTAKNDDKIGLRNDLIDLQIINLTRSKFLIQDNEYVQNLFDDPEACLELSQKEDSYILYKIDDVVDELLSLIVKCVLQKNLNGIMEMIHICCNQINSMNISDLEAFIHLMGIIIKSCYYADSVHSKRCVALCDGPTIVDSVTRTFINCEKTELRISWENFVIKRCVWLLAKWVVDDPNIGSISMSRIGDACRWCFKIAHSSVNVFVKIEVVLFIEHLIDALDKMPSDFVDTPLMHETFLNPSISIVVSLLDETQISDTHARLIEVLIKLLNATNMWDNIELVKTCANSIYNLWNCIKWPTRETLILRDRLLECLSTVVKSCNPVIIQPILATLFIFIHDSLQLVIKPLDKGTSAADNRSILLDNTLQLWHDLVYNCETTVEGLDSTYSLIVVSDAVDVELDKNQTTLLLEIIQAHFLLKVIGSVNRESFHALTLSSWNYITKQAWDPKQEEDLCVMRIQLFDLWLLGFHQLSMGPISTLLEINSYCQFLCERTKELFTSTNDEPSNDRYICVVNSTLTVLARICLFDRSIIKNLLSFLSNGDAENQQLVIGLLNRWLLRIDNQSSCSIQQLFVLACIQWLPCCIENDPNILSAKLETLINSCIQICSYVPNVSVSENTELAKALPIPAERHLRLAYILWNPLSNYASEIKKLVTTFMAGLNNSVGLDNFQNMFNNLDPTVQSQFIQLCTTTN